MAAITGQLMGYYVQHRLVGYGAVWMPCVTETLWWWTRPRSNPPPVLFLLHPRGVAPSYFVHLDPIKWWQRLINLVGTMLVYVLCSACAGGWGVVAAEVVWRFPWLANRREKKRFQKTG